MQDQSHLLKAHTAVALAALCAVRKLHELTRGSYAAIQQRPDSDTLVSPVTPPTAEVFQLNGFHCMYRQERGIACIAQSEKHFHEFLFVLDLFLKTVLTVFTMSHLKQVCRGSTHFFYTKKRGQVSQIRNRAHYPILFSCRLPGVIGDRGCEQTNAMVLDLLGVGREIYWMP